MAVTYQPQYRLTGTTSWVNWGAALTSSTLTVVVGNSTTPLSAGTPYQFQVVASDSFGSTPSNVVSATTTSGVSISSIVLSGSKAFTTGTNNAVVGTIAVALSSGTFSGTLGLSGADSASFQIVNVGGVNTLETNGALATAKTYTVSIVANQQGASNTPFTSAPQSIVGSNPVVATFTIPMGLSLGAELNSSGAGGSPTPYADYIAHYNGFTTGMGRTPTVIGCVGANSADTPFSAPNQWGGGNSSSLAAISTSLVPVCTWTFSNGTISNDFTDYANATTATFNGTTYANWIIQSITAWKTAGFTKMYIRINWEFEPFGPGAGWPIGTNIVAWRNAWRGFANAAHSVSGIRVKLVWCAAISGDSSQGNPSGVDVRAFFPAVTSSGRYIGAFADGFPGATSTNPNAVNGVTHVVDASGQFVEVVGPDIYAFSGGSGTCYPEAIATDNSFWFTTSMIPICQDNHCTFAISELGSYSTSTWSDWIPNHFTTYFNTLKNLSVPVPIEYISFWDNNIGGSFMFSNDSQAVDTDLTGWRSCCGGTAAGSPPLLRALNPVTTIASYP